MDEISILKKDNEILQKQNSDLAEGLQHWKSEYFRLEDEKINLLRENIRYKQQIIKFRNIENMVRQNLSHSLSDIVKSTNHIRKIIETLDGQEIDIWNKQISPLPVRSPLQSNAQNVNHVQPMIQGVTIKKPVIRISRASLSNIIRTTEPAMAIEDSENDSPTLDTSNNTSESGITLSQIDSLRLLDVCVPLHRIDQPGNINRSNGVSESNPLSQTTDVDGSQESESSSQNSGYSEEQNGSANIISGEPIDYPSRLECILEESETESINNWVNSRKKLNPYVVINNTLDYDQNSSSVIQRTPIKVGKHESDDPMEGSSWHFDEQHVNLRSKQKTTLKKNSCDVEGGDDNSLESSQVPDSTTNGISLSRDSNQEQDPSFAKTFPSVMEFHSTPVASMETDQKENLTPSREFSKMEHSPSQQPIEVKVVLSKMGSTSRNSKSSDKKKRKLKGSSKTSIINSRSTPKRRNKKSSSQLPEESSLFQSSCEENQLDNLSRPRRGEMKNYKEKPLNKKMRRSK